jgi:DNA-directed RNA polymerase subunit RPC12/RpoP
MTMNPRVKVIIRCKNCGERFTLKGKKERGEINTGFKQCICDNETEFDVKVDDI